MKTTFNKYLVILVLIPFLLITILYASFNSELLITGTAMVRISSDIRITNLKVIEQINGAYETYSSEFNKDSTSIYASLPNIDSTITYEVTIKNSTNSFYSLKRILELSYTNSNIKYEIMDAGLGSIIESNSERVFRIKFYYDSDILPSDISNVLILKYEFVENQFVDLSGNENDGVNKGATYSFTNQLISTNGSTYVDCGLKNHDFGKDITYVISVRFDNEDLSSEKFIFGNWESAGGGLSIYKNHLSFSLYVNKYYIFPSTFIPKNGVWYTLVGMYDGAKFSLWVNGVKQSIDTSISLPGWSEGRIENVVGTIRVSTTDIAIGANLNSELSPNNWDILKASYKAALVFDRALTEEEIKSDYFGEINVTNPTDLLFYYDFTK